MVAPDACKECMCSSLAALRVVPVVFMRDFLHTDEITKQTSDGKAVVVVFLNRLLLQFTFFFLGERMFSAL